MRSNKRDTDKPVFNQTVPVTKSMTNATPGTLAANRMSNGYDLTNGYLHILIPDKLAADAKKILEGLRKDFADADEAIKPKITIEDCTTEIDRLVNLTKHLVSGEPFDLFQYLPLTKQGKFPNNQNILIADSKVTTAATWTGGSNDYPEKLSVQLRLMPYYDTTNDFIYGNAMEDTRILELHWFDSLKKRTPVFDTNNNPAKPETTRAAYLKDNEVKPGYVYEEKSGTQYLCLTGLPCIATVIYHRPDGNNQFHYDFRQTDYHRYTRWTKKLETKLANAQDMSTFMRIMAENDKHNETPWIQTGKLSNRETPRKFVKEVCQVIDISLTKEDAFDIHIDDKNNPEFSTTFRYQTFEV